MHLGARRMFVSVGSTMINSDPGIERRLQQLARELRALTERVDGLTSRLAAADLTPSHPPESLDEAFAFSPSKDWGGATLLAGTAAVCFLLVLALVLRTLADNHIIDLPLGAAAGLVYAALILVFGYYRARARLPFASLLATCGVSLVMAIVLESHTRFEILPTTTAYIVLASTLAAMLAAALRYRAFGPLNFAIPGVTLVAMSLHFPEPDFAQLATLIAFTLVAAFVVAPWARPAAWMMLVLTLFFWMWWTLKLRVALDHETAPDEYLRYGVYWPFLGGFVALYAAHAYRMARGSPSAFSLFESVSPALVSLCAYTAGAVVMNARGGIGPALGWAAAAAAVIYVVLIRRFERGAVHAASSFGIAALLLLALATPALTTQPALRSPALAVTAAAFATYAAVRLEPGVVLCTVLVQICGFFLAFYSGGFSTETSGIGTVAGLLAAGGVCVFHYERIRAIPLRNPDGETAGIAERSTRVSSIAVLWAALAYAFGAARLTLDELVPRLTETPADVFTCGQSVIINAGALLIALVALNRRRTDLAGTAVVVAAIGALKVFGFDLLKTHGVPLVVDVFVFGLTATAGSFLWSRWQQERDA